MTDAETIEAMGDRMQLASEIAERLINNASTMDTEQVKRTGFGILALLTVDLDAQVTKGAIDELYKDL